MNDKTIAQQVAELRARTVDRGARPAIPAFTDEQDELHARAAAVSAKIGTPVPDVQVVDATGATTTLAAAIAGAPSVVVLYRGVWCPYCNIALGTYQRDLHPALVARGVTLVAVSPQAPDGSLTMQEKQELRFPVLSDAGNVLAKQLGVTVQPAPEALAAQREHGLDVTEFNADGGTELPMPAVLVLDAAGTIRWIEAQADYTARSEVADILAAVEAVTGAPPTTGAPTPSR